MKEPMFYEMDAVLKYNMCNEGLYLNDEFGIKNHTTPYFGVHYNDTCKKWIANVSITKDIIEDLSNDIIISRAINRGIITQKFLESEWPSLMVYKCDNPRDAAYVAQKFRFSEYKYDLYRTFIIKRYVEKTLENTELLEEVGDIPEWTTEVLTLDKYDIAKFKMNSAMINKAKKEKELMVINLVKNVQIEKNRKRIIKNAQFKLAKDINIDINIIKERVDIEKHIDWNLGIPQLKNYADHAFGLDIQALFD